MISAESLSKQLAAQDYLDAGMISAALDYWFNNQVHIRSPFPEYMQKELATEAAASMLAWTRLLNDKARKELTSEMLAEKFEEFLFETGLRLAKTEDEKITIRYPFLPRTGDILEKKNEDTLVAESEVISRAIIKNGDLTFLRVEMREKPGGETWFNEFELPE